MINLALLWWWRDEYKKWVAREKQRTGIEQAGQQQTQMVQQAMVMAPPN